MTKELLQLHRCRVTSPHPARVTLATLATLVTFVGARGEDKVTYEEHVHPILMNHCLKCHNPDKIRGELDLSTFGGVLKGGGSGPAVLSGDADGSKLVKSMTHAEEPTMPPNAPKIPEKELDVIRKWIAGGLLEKSGSQTIAAARPKVDLSLTAASIGRPEGPPPMPGKLALEPVVRTARPTALTGLAASPWAAVAALGGQKQIVCYNPDSQEFLGVIPFEEGFPNDLKFSRNGRLLVAGGGYGSKSGHVVVWDITTGEKILAIGGEYDSVLASDISSDQQWIALGGPERVVKIYSTKTGELQHRLKKHTDWVTALEFSPDSRHLVTGDRNGNLFVWEAATGQEVFTLNGHRQMITAISWRGDSAVLASSSEDGTIKLWNAKDGQQAKSWNAHNGGALSVDFGHDARLVSCGRDNRVTLWDRDGNAQRAFSVTVPLPVRAAFVHDGQRVIAADLAGKVSVWNTADGKPLGELPSNPPSLADRIDAGNRQIDALQAAVSKAATELAGLETGLNNARGGLEKANKAVADARAAVAAGEKEIKGLSSDPKRDAADPEVKNQIEQLRKSVKAARARLETAAKEVETRTREIEAATAKVANARLAVEKAERDLAHARSALARWKAAQQTAQAPAPAGGSALVTR